LKKRSENTAQIRERRSRAGKITTKDENKPCSTAGNSEETCRAVKDEGIIIIKMEVSGRGKLIYYIQFKRKLKCWRRSLPVWKRNLRCYHTVLCAVRVIEEQTNFM
jgi:hypothetical protein